MCDIVCESDLGQLRGQGQGSTPDLYQGHPEEGLYGFVRESPTFVLGLWDPGWKGLLSHRLP